MILILQLVRQPIHISHPTSFSCLLLYNKPIPNLVAEKSTFIIPQNIVDPLDSATFIWHQQKIFICLHKADVWSGPKSKRRLYPHINIQISEYEVTYLTLLEKDMTTHSSILAWRIPCTEEPRVHELMGSQSQTWLSGFHFILHWVYIRQSLYSDILKLTFCLAFSII